MTRRWQKLDEPPLGGLYIGVLDLLHLELHRIAAQHDEHLLDDGPDWCSPDRDGGTVCDDLGGLLLDAVNDAFVPEHLAEWVEHGPDDLLEWYSELGGCTPVEVILGALRYDAEGRLLVAGNGWPA